MAKKRRNEKKRQTKGWNMSPALIPGMKFEKRKKV